jgi:hypothetical protein
MARSNSFAIIADDGDTTMFLYAHDIRAAPCPCVPVEPGSGYEAPNRNPRCVPPACAARAASIWSRSVNHACNRSSAAENVTIATAQTVIRHPPPSADTVVAERIRLLVTRPRMDLEVGMRVFMPARACRLHSHALSARAVRTSPCRHCAGSFAPVRIARSFGRFRVAASGR